MSSPPVRAEYLRGVKLFEPLDDHHLASLLDRSSQVELQAGERLFSEGEPGDALFVLLDGELHISRRVREVEDVIARRGPGEVVGEMSLVSGKPRTATVRAAVDSRLLRVSKAAFQEMILGSPEAAAAILECMAGRIEEDQANRAREERLVALGTMAAGLAHELNNPAAALARTTGALAEAQRARLAAGVSLLEGGDVPPSKVAELWSEAERRAAEAGRTAARVTAAEEDQLTDALEELGLERPWDSAAPLLQSGWDAAAVRELIEGGGTPMPLAALRWLAADATVRTLTDEVRMAADAIVEQVTAVKVASHMDRARFDVVDVRTGMESALVMVKRKLGGAVTVVREYAPDLPLIEAYPAELNQVWTNLVDNALDAMGGSGVLTLRVSSGGDQVSIEVSDTGPGIPPDVLPRLFEPYFTTKGVGEGTGLGLPLARKTVEQRHGGRLSVRSSPGGTTFVVTLPVTQSRAAVGAEGEA